jgi:hypothetical protein
LSLSYLCYSGYAPELPRALTASTNAPQRRGIRLEDVNPGLVVIANNKPILKVNEMSDVAEGCVLITTDGAWSSIGNRQDIMPRFPSTRHLVQSQMLRRHFTVGAVRLNRMLDDLVAVLDR